MRAIHRECQWQLDYAKLVAVATATYFRLKGESPTRPLFLSYTESEGAKWGTLIVSGTANGSRPIPANLDEAALYDWIDEAASIMPICATKDE
jgi:hypothetical protein